MYFGLHLFTHWKHLHTDGYQRYYFGDRRYYRWEGRSKQGGASEAGEGGHFLAASRHLSSVSSPLISTLPVPKTMPVAITFCISEVWALNFMTTAGCLLSCSYSTGLSADRRCDARCLKLIRCPSLNRPMTFFTVGRSFPSSLGLAVACPSPPGSAFTGTMVWANAKPGSGGWPASSTAITPRPNGSSMPEARVQSCHHGPIGACRCRAGLCAYMYMYSSWLLSASTVQYLL